MANGRAQEKLLCAAIRLRICATVISIHYTGCITQVFFQNFLIFLKFSFLRGFRLRGERNLPARQGHKKERTKVPSFL
ncbi:hypothetical protein DWV55_01015 [Butyricicoccus sp. AF10-3]|nr:hypothetical protein DWV55_01015 [Butyricicoccus sp. AF10-3]